MDLFKLNLALTNPKASLELKLQKIVATASEHVPQADVVSLWVFDQNHTRIQCIARLDKQTQHFSRGGTICQSDAHTYFNAILQHDFLAIEDVHQHPFTQKMATSYFEPHGFHALLDYILHDDFEAKGIICCESRKAGIQWQDGEKSAISRIANVSSLFFNLASVQNVSGDN